MKAAALLIVAILCATPAMLAGCAGAPPIRQPSPPSQSKHVVWAPLNSEEEVADTCGGDHTIGCAFQLSDLCVLVSQVPPELEYSHDISTHQSEIWKVLGHELLHCFGWQHWPMLIRTQ